jgi:hypothetical protein
MGQSEEILRSRGFIFLGSPSISTRISVTGIPENINRWEWQLIQNCFNQMASMVFIDGNPEHLAVGQIKAKPDMPGF